VQITSRRGTVQIKAAITDRVPADVLFLPMHWGDQFVPGNAANYLTISAIGRVAKQPELKHCAVHVAKAHVQVEEPLADLLHQSRRPAFYVMRK
jgi:assimilatory nitrate reductase catalytic subunit